MTESVWIFREGPDLRWEAAAACPPWAYPWTGEGDVLRVALPPGLPVVYALTLLDHLEDVASGGWTGEEPVSAASTRRVAQQLTACSRMLLTKEEALRMAGLLHLRWDGAYTGADSTEGSAQVLALNLAERLEVWVGPVDETLPGWDGELALTLTDALWLRWSLDESDLEDDVLMLPDEADAPEFRSMHRGLQRVVPRIEGALEALGSSRDGRCPDLPAHPEDRAATPISVLS